MTVTPDPAVAGASSSEASTKSAPLANRPIGTITADLVGAASRSGETALGDVIADAQLAATQQNGAQIAMTNPGGIRDRPHVRVLSVGEGDGVVTYGEAFAVQPFGNMMQTVTMTGAQLDAVLEQQWQDGQRSAEWSCRSPEPAATPWTAGQRRSGARVSNLRLNGGAIDRPAQLPRVDQQLPGRWAATGSPSSPRPPM